VKEYAERLYTPAAKAHQDLAGNGCKAATELSQWKARMRKDWPQVQIYDVQIGNENRHNILVGDALRVTAKVHLGAVDPKHVRVEAYYGEPEGDGLSTPSAAVLEEKAHEGRNGHYVYEGAVPASESGTYAFGIRVVPTHPHLMQAHELRLITWS
jgi:starch phosphorylase